MSNLDHLLQRNKEFAAQQSAEELPGAWLISGLVYDVATGLVEIVVPPAPIRTAETL